MRVGERGEVAAVGQGWGNNLALWCCTKTVAEQSRSGTRCSCLWSGRRNRYIGVDLNAEIPPQWAYVLFGPHRGMPRFGKTIKEIFQVHN